MEHKLAQKAIEKKDEKRMSEDTPSPEDGPDINNAAPAPWTPYPFNSGQPRQDTAHIFEIPSLLFGGKPPSFPAIIEFHYSKNFDKTIVQQKLTHT